MMSLWNLIMVLILLSVASGHVTRILVTGVIFEGMRRWAQRRGEAGSAFWAWFSEGIHCQLCSGVWVGIIVSLWWTVALYVLFPGLWDSIAGRPLGRLNPAAWISLFLAQTFFISATGHLFREVVGLVEDRRTSAEEEAAVLERTAQQMDRQR